MSFGIPVRNGLSVGIASYATLASKRSLWTPSQLTTSVWLDAADASTITLNGSTVSQWNDKSGNGRHATQVLGANQPTYQGPGLIYLDGISDHMNYTLSGFSTQGTAIVAFKPDNDTNYGLLHSDGNDFSRFSGDGYTYPLTFRTVRANLATNAFTSTDTQIYEITADSVAPSYNIYRNGVSAYSSTSSFIFGVLPDRVGGNQVLKGWIYEIVVCNSVLSTANRQRIEGYLAWKWGMQADLPVGHPYKNTPPTV